MTTKDIKTVELIVNSDQAKAKLDELNTKLDTMKKKREDALNRGDSKALSVYTREVSKIEKENQELKFALGETDNTHDLLIAQEKASTALQYTIALRDKFLESYKELMNMQI